MPKVTKTHICGEARDDDAGHRDKHGRRQGTVDAGTSTGGLMLVVLGGLADVERDPIRTRTAESREQAMKRG
jgi:hypothetical protein